MYSKFDSFVRDKKVFVVFHFTILLRNRLVLYYIFFVKWVNKSLFFFRVVNQTNKINYLYWVVSNFPTILENPGPTATVLILDLSESTIHVVKIKWVIVLFSRNVITIFPFLMKIHVECLNYTNIILSYAWNR